MDLMWLGFASVRWSISGLFLLMLMMFCRSKTVLCIPLVLNVTAFMGGCLYSFVFVYCSAPLCVGSFGAFVEFCLEVLSVRCQFFLFSSVVCL